MDMKSHYTAADSGMVVDTWRYVKFSSLFGDPSRNGIYKAPQFQGRGTRIVNMGEMFGLEFISDQEMSRVELSKQEVLLSGLQDGDLLFGRRSVVPAGAGKCSLIVSPSEALTFESSIIRTRLNKTKTYPLFYYYFFASPVGRLLVSSIVAGTNVKGIRASELKELIVPLPKMAEQKAIAEALSDADALIESLEQLLAKKRLIKQGAMQELLTGKRRLAGFKDEWALKTLGEISSIDPENLNSNTRPDYSFKYISLEDVDVGTLRSYSEQLFSSAPSRARRKLRKNDVLVSTVRPNLQSHLFFEREGDDWVCSTGFSIIRCDSAIANSKYIFFHLFANGVSRQIEALLTGSNYPAINSRDVRDLYIPFPPYEEQTAIAEILSDMDAELAALEARLKKARQIKQGMMAELLTGRIRLV